MQQHAAHEAERTRARRRREQVGAGGRASFTLIELLVVVTVLLVLVALLMPVLGRALGQAKRVVCVSNMRQLVNAWFTYQADNGGSFVGAGDGQWVGGSDDRSAITDYLLYPHAGSVEIYRCPCDPWPHLRTYSINGYLSEPTWSTWSAYPVATRYAQLRQPASTFVFIEEYDERGHNLSGYIACTSWDPDVWVDSVASWHFKGVNMTFADGHLEGWTWRDPRTLLLDGGHFIPSPQNPDLLRLAQNLGCP